MNYDLLATSTSSSNTTSRMINTQRKPNLLSTHLAFDDEELNFDSINVGDEESSNFNKRFKESEECIEILASMPEIPLPRVKVSNDRSIPTNHSNLNTSINISTNSSNSNQESYVNIWNDNLIESATPRRAQYRVIFEIIKARTITNSDRQRYVNYTILMKRVPGLETEPAIIERRYSEFRNFYNAIKRKYPTLLKDVVFPKKIFIGNFSAEVIAERSAAFQRFLTYCLSLTEIRSSKEFASFLYYPELIEAKNCLKSIRIEEAASIFENVHYIQSKLSFQNEKPNSQLIHTLCCLIGCLNAVDNTIEAKKLANKTFELLFENPIVIVADNTTNGNNNNSIYEVNNLYETSQLVLPLILLSLRHGWFSGRQKAALENKLEEICRKRSLPRNADSHPKLLEIILRKDFSPIL